MISQVPEMVILSRYGDLITISGEKTTMLIANHHLTFIDAAGIINFVHINGKENPADICTKHTSTSQWFKVMKPLIYWRARNGKLGSHLPNKGEGECQPIHLS